VQGAKGKHAKPVPRQREGKFVNPQFWKFATVTVEVMSFVK